MQSFLVRTYSGMTDITILRKAIRVTDLYVEANVHFLDHSYAEYGLSEEDICEVLSYREMFHGLPKNVYLLGSPGRGKTIFCLRLVETWVKAVSKRNLGVQTGYDSLTDEQLFLAETFDLVLFVSLRNAEANESIRDMIHSQIFLENPNLSRYVDDCLSKMPQRVLVLLDGLDEWPGFVENRTLSRAGLNNCLTLITSRHSVLDTLRIHANDRAFEIRELSEANVTQLAENVLNQVFHSPEPSTKAQAFAHALKQSKLPVVTEVPIILAFLVCLWFESTKSKFEDSLTSLYAHILEFLLRDHKRINRDFGKDSHRRLPSLLLDYPMVNQHRDLLLSVGSFAYDCLLNDNTGSFSKMSLEGMLGQEQMHSCLSTGILTLLPVPDTKSRGKVQVAFFHKTIQDYLAAIFIAADVCGPSKKVSQLDKLFHHISTMGKALELGNVLTFVCGFVPSLSSKISKHIDTVAARCPQVESYRHSLAERYKFSHNYSIYRYVKNIQRLQKMCYVEAMRTESFSSQSASERIIVAFGVPFEYRLPPDKFVFSDVAVVDKIDDIVVDMLSQNAKELKSVYIDLPDKLDTTDIHKAILNTSKVIRLRLDKACSFVLSKLSPLQTRYLQSISIVLRDADGFPDQFNSFNVLTHLSLDIFGGHELIHGLQAFFFSKTTLKELEINRLQCVDRIGCPVMCKMALNLTKQVAVRRLRLDNVNSSCTLISSSSDLEELEISGMTNNPSSVLCHLPSMNLTSLTIGHLGRHFRWTKSDYEFLKNCLSRIQSLRRLRLLGVRYFYLEVSERARALKEICLQNVAFSVNGWEMFLQSLLNSSCKAEVEIYHPENFALAEQYLRKAFQSVDVVKGGYRFQTRPVGGRT